MRRFLVCAILSFLTISVDQQSRYLNPIRSVISVVVSPVHYFVDFQVATISFASDYFEQKKTLIESAKSLRNQNLKLSAKAQRYSALERENARLRTLLGSPVIVDEKIILARILAIETNSGFKQVVINKGTNCLLYTSPSPRD